MAVAGKAEELIATAQAAVAAGDHAAALCSWQDLLAQYPDSQAEALCGMAEAHLALENYDEALDHVAALTALSPHYGPMRHLRARILGHATLRVRLRLVPLEILPGFRITITDETLIRRELRAVPLRLRLRGARVATGTLVLEAMDGTEHKHPLAGREDLALGGVGPRALWRRWRGIGHVTLRVDLRKVRRIGVIPNDAAANGETIWTHHVVSADVPTCLEGQDGWLFLTNDGNQSDAIFTGQVQLALWRRLAWVHYAWRLGRATRQLRQQGVKLAFVIAPSKETVMPQVYPLRRGARNLSESVAAILQRAKIPLVFPVARLAATPGSYCRTDTHWSHAGAFAALEDCLSQFGLQGVWRAQIDFVPLEVMGDLGGKMSPAATDDMLVARWPGQERAEVLYRSGLATTGEIVIFDNPQATLQEVLVVFGGSSASTLAYLASRIFRRVVRVNSPSTQPVMEVIAAEGAAYVICQTNERYLQRAPRLVQRLDDSAIPAAVAALDNPTRLRVQAACNAAGEDNRYAAFLSRCLRQKAAHSDPAE